MERQKCAFPVKRESNTVWPQHQQLAAVVFQAFTAANLECPGVGHMRFKAPCDLTLSRALLEPFQQRWAKSGSNSCWESWQADVSSAVLGWRVSGSSSAWRSRRRQQDGWEGEALLVLPIELVCPIPALQECSYRSKWVDILTGMSSFYTWSNGSFFSLGQQIYHLHLQYGMDSWRTCVHVEVRAN